MSFTTDLTGLKNSISAYALLIKNKFALMIPTSEKGALNGVAPLVNGLIPSQYLPSFVDDILEYNGIANFPAVGESGKIYVDTSLTDLPAYRWTGSGYLQVNNHVGTADSAATAARLTTTRTISATGDATWSVNFDGTGNATATLTLNTVPVTKGGTGATTQSGARTNLGLVIGTDVQAQNTDLSAIAGIAGTSGLLKKTAAGAWTLDTSTYSLSSHNHDSIYAPIGHVGTNGTAHSVVTTTVNGFMSAADKTKLDAISGTNTGDETTATIKSKLGITTLSGSNTGDQTSVSGNAGTATKLATARDITMTGDGSWTVNFDGSGNVSGVFTINTVPITKGGTGATTQAAARTNLGLVIGTDVQAQSADLTAIDALAGTAGFLKKTATNTWTLDTSTYSLSTHNHDSAYAPIGHVGSSGSAHAVVTTTVNGFMTAADKNKLDAISGTNTGDETTASVKSLLGITTLSGSNTGDETTATIKSKLGISTLSGSNTGDQSISISGDVTAGGSFGNLVATVTKINGVSLATLGTGLLKNTNGTGVPSIATPGSDYLVPSGALGTPSSGNLSNCTFPTLNQNTTGTAAVATTANGLNTGNNYQMNSLGVGTAPSGTAGEIRATNDVTAFYSDKRLKNILGNIPNALDAVCSLNGVIYTNNHIANQYGYTTNKEQVGVLAQEVQAVLPQVVTAAPFDIGQNKDGTEFSLSGENYLTVKYEKLVPLLIEAIKELREEVRQLKGN